MEFQPIARLLTSNSQWAEDVAAAEPSFFEESAKGQAPKVLWIGCADSRVPESVVMACRPGDVFVHRNIANQFPTTDDSANSVLQYAVDVLGVEHVVVVGHTNCGGALACYTASCEDSQKPASALHRWLEPLTDLARQLNLRTLPSEIAVPLLIEENVKTQVANVIRTETMRKAWEHGRDVHVHGWIYEIEKGRVRDLGISVGPGDDTFDVPTKVPLVEDVVAN